jgi:hypothetical protein
VFNGAALARLVVGVEFCKPALVPVARAPNLEKFVAICALVGKRDDFLNFTLRANCCVLRQRKRIDGSRKFGLH